MEDELPAGWLFVNLGDALAAIIGGGTPSKERGDYFQGDIPLMTVKDMKTRRPTETGFNITQEALSNSSAKLVPPDTVIIATRMGLGKVVRAPFETAINQDLKALFPAEGVEKSFLEFWLLAIAKKLEGMGTGTTVKGIRLNDVTSLNFPLAPTGEQRRVVEKIETLFARLDKGEEAMRQVQALLKRYRQSVLKAAVTGDLIGVDALCWPEINLEALLLDIRYGTAKKCRPEEHGTAVLRIPNVVSGEIDLNDLKYTELEGREVEKLALEKGDLLIVRSNGSANLVGRGAVVSDEAEGLAFAGYLIRLRPDRSRVLSDFLHLVLSSPQVRANVERQARSTSGVHNINSGELQAITFRLPPPELQAAIVQATEIHMAKLGDLETWCETELARSSALRQSILKQAFSGRLVPQDPSDEPASELLARIHAAGKTKNTRKAG